MGAFGTDSTLSYPDYRDFHSMNRSFDGLVASGLRAFGFSRDGKRFPKALTALTFPEISAPDRTQRVSARICNCYTAAQ
jgi:hypothetical protein